MKKGKRGLSTIVITLIIILVSIVAIGIIWIAVRNVIQRGSEDIEMGQFTMDASVEVIGINETRNNVSLIVTRNPGRGDFTGVVFLFENATGKETVTRHFILYELEARGFELHLEILGVTNITKLSIYPLYKTSSNEFTMGSKTDEYIFTGIEKFLFKPGGGAICGNNIREMWEACDGTDLAGQTCTSQGFTSGNLACYLPGDMQECKFDTSQCQGGTPSCTPATCASLGYDCGSGYSNGTCAGTLNCNTPGCGSQASCSSGTCVCNSGWADCNSDDTCECNLASSSCSEGSCVLNMSGNITGNFRYVRAGATGSNNGSDWTNAYSTLPMTLLRNYTYFIADGDYTGYSFDDAVSGTQYITIKKAIESDHGTDTGWDSSYGDGQAVFSNSIIFTTDYYILDGNGDFSIPSDDTNDYGFKVNANSIADISGIVRFAGGSYITLKYVHVYNSYNGDINCGTVGLRFTGSSGHIKVQNCFLENSGKDGIQISGAQYVLVERCYIKRYGKLYGESPDYHGQTVQIFSGGGNIIFRWNVWEACEGQGLVQIAGINDMTQNVRFYGSIVFVDYNKNPSTPGFNTGGGIFGDAWNYYGESNIYLYHNTFVNIGGDYGGVAQFPFRYGIGNNKYSYNNLAYNCESTGYSNWDAYGYHASGGGDTLGGTSEQTGLSSSIFLNYQGNDFRLSSATNSGIDVTQQSWWDESDSFFGFLDSNLDMYSNTRGADGTWDRGAYEYAS